MTSREKYGYLLEKTLSDSNGVIRMKDMEAKTFLIEHPRNYDLFVIFTAPVCKLCQTIDPEFYKVAKAYKDKKMFYPRKSKESKKIKKPMFFM